MIVIFASSYDKAAASLAARWATQNASVLTCDDLSRAGWRHYLGTKEAATAVVGGRIIPVEEIAGVLIRWPGVFPQELSQIAVADRNYVAGEMTAFLVSWFTSLNCPVINRPTPLNLAGPAWRVEQWTHAAAQLGIPVRSAHRHVASNANCHQAEAPHANSSTVTVVGERCFGSVDQALLSWARLLAQAAQVFLLKVSFSGREENALFTGADLIPDISDEVADAILESILTAGRFVFAANNS